MLMIIIIIIIIKPEKTQAYRDSNQLERCNGIAEVRVRSPESLNFFRLSFRNGISCLYNCDDLLWIYFFIQQFKLYEIHIFIITIPSKLTKKKRLKREQPGLEITVNPWFLMAHQVSSQGPVREDKILRQTGSC